MLTKQLACTALERGFAESEVQSLLVQQRALIQQALQKDALNTELQVRRLIRVAMRLSCVVCGDCLYRTTFSSLSDTAAASLSDLYLNQNILWAVTLITE